MSMGLRTFIFISYAQQEFNSETHSSPATVIFKPLRILATEVASILPFVHQVATSGKNKETRTSAGTMSKRVMIVVSLALLAATVSAQSFIIRGIVTDQSGAVIPGVHITLLHKATGVTLEAITDGRGMFAIPTMNAGEIEVTADL